MGRAGDPRLTELSLIRSIQSTFSGIRGRGRQITLGIGDDCAILRPRAGADLLVTTDLLVEGWHFRRETHPAISAGYRCLARGLSDLAAMGGLPVAAFLSLASPPDLLGSAAGRRWLRGFFAGMRELAGAWQVPLAGGDTAEAPGPRLVADIVLLGTVPTGTALRRDGARPGDQLYVTGALGGSAAELRALLAKPQREGDPPPPPPPPRWRERATEEVFPQRFPQPRLGVGDALRRRALASAAIDLSDGLSTDLQHLCQASGVSGEVWAEALPVHPLAARLPPGDRLPAMLHGGEDYELLFAAPPGTRLPRRIAGVTVTAIGRLLEPDATGPGLTLVTSSGREPLQPGGWEHFRGRRSTNAARRGASEQGKGSDHA